MTATERNIMDQLALLRNDDNALQNILEYVKGFDNKIIAIPTAKHIRSKEDQEILDGFREAILELKEIKAGRGQARSFDDFIAEVEQKEMAGYYD